MAGKRVKKSHASFGVAGKTTNYNPMNISSGRAFRGTVCFVKKMVRKRFEVVFVAAKEG